MESLSHDAAAAFRILSLPLADLLDRLIMKGILTVDEACECLETRVSGEASGPLAQQATNELERLEQALREMQDYPRLQLRM